MSRKRIAGPHSSSHRHWNPAKKTLSLHWSLERHLSSPWVPLLFVNLSGKCRFPSGLCCSVPDMHSPQPGWRISEIRPWLGCSTWTGIAHRLGHRNKNHINWLVSMATRLLICPSVISPMDKLDVESLRILLYIIACKKGQKMKLLKWCNYKRAVAVGCFKLHHQPLPRTALLPVSHLRQREMETEWEKAQERELTLKNSNSS